jgi:hypothetical protein
VENWRTGVQIPPAPPYKARKHWAAVEKVAESRCGLRLF